MNTQFQKNLNYNFVYLPLLFCGIFKRLKKIFTTGLNAGFILVVGKFEQRKIVFYTNMNYRWRTLYKEISQKPLFFYFIWEDALGH